MTRDHTVHSLSFFSPVAAEETTVRVGVLGLVKMANGVGVDVCVRRRHKGGARNTHPQLGSSRPF